MRTADWLLYGALAIGLYAIWRSGAIPGIRVNGLGAPDPTGTGATFTTDPTLIQGPLFLFPTGAGLETA